MQKGAASTFARDPGRVRDLVRAIAARDLSPIALVQRYLDRITEADRHVQCWREIDAERALTTAREREAEAAIGKLRGPLHGLPVAIKDIIDVEGLPTRANSRSRASMPAASNDAEVVLALKAAGAIVLGKVHTTEFAFFDPSPARNPHNLEHTPGGSSSGSAAAVAAGMAPTAVGTQTVASVNRPAAYCGIAAFKPSSRSLPAFGITPLGPSYDTPGFYGWSVEDAVTVYEAVAPPFARSWQKMRASNKLSICVLDDAHVADAIPEMKAAVERFAHAFASAGHAVEQPKSPIPFERLFKIQRSTMAYEAGRALRFLLDQPAGTVGDKITALVHEGLAITPDQYLDERRDIDTMRETLFGKVAANVFLWPAVPATAPKGLSWTGDPKYISPWTALGGPIVSVPAGSAGDGLPIGCILTARPGTDAQMCRWARELSKLVN
jgi:Asp-tRNA(Asn)/Glu-tRNA(Gln) amidotransferase A subunit family amidase